MSDLDIYDETENLISSDDEFSEDDDDDLMNAAISSQNTSKSEVSIVGASYTAARPKDLMRPQQAHEDQNKLKEIKLLMKRKKFSSFYKKRSIKWLNNKERREKYKEYLMNIKRNQLVTPPPPTKPKPSITAETGRKSVEDKKPLAAPAVTAGLIRPAEHSVADTIELDDTDVEISPEKKDIATAAPVSKMQKIAIDDDDDERVDEFHIVNVQSKQEVVETPKIDVPQRQEVTSNCFPVLPPSNTNNKRVRSPSPSPTALDNHINSNNNNNNNFNEAKRQQPPPAEEKASNSTTNTTTTSSGSGSGTGPSTGTDNATGTGSGTGTGSSSSFSLYREINEAFPKFDEVLGQHIKTGNSTIDAIGENMTRILLDIQTINDILQTKESEWNRLLHLKNVKEEILTRLVRKKHMLELRDKYSGDGQASSAAATLSELKELETYLSESTQTASASNRSSSSSLPMTTRQLVESRANMTREDLEKERNNINRLQSILISSNILPRTENSNNHFGVVAAKDNNLPKSCSTPTPTAKQQQQEQQQEEQQQQLMQSYQYLENRGDSSNYIVGRQGPFKDVKSIIADFRQKNPEVLPRVGKRIKLNDPPPTIASIRTSHKTSYLSQPLAVVNNLSIESTYDAGSSINYTPTLEKLLSASSRNNNNNSSSPSIIQLKRSTPYTQSLKYQNQNHSSHHGSNEGQNTYYSLESVNDDEVSITPVIGSKHRYLLKDVGGEGHHEYKADLLRSALRANQLQSTNVVYVDEADHRHHQNHQSSGSSKQSYRHIGIGNGEIALHESDVVPFCQECKTHEARFVCAGCGNQWYCSRSCQISAWDKHSDSCSE